jgi:hypothetical protein
VEAYRVARRRGSQLKWLTDGGEVRLTRRPTLTPQKDSWYSFLLEAESTPRAIVRQEGLGEVKNIMTSSGIEPTSFRLV